MKLWHKVFLPLPSLAIGLFNHYWIGEREKAKKEVIKSTFEVSIRVWFGKDQIWNQIWILSLISSPAVSAKREFYLCSNEL